MTSRSHVSLPGLLLLALATLLVVPFLGVAAQADPSDPADPAAPSATAAPQDPQEVAEEALEKVEELLEDSASPQQAHQAHHGKDLTLALRDLAVSRENLPTRLKDDAARLLARPTDSGSNTCEDGPACYGTAPSTRICSALVCVHHSTAGTQRATASFATMTRDIVTAIARRYGAAGYRAPVADGSEGGDARFDVYLADVGAQGYYGYCTTDAKNIQGHGGAPAYCVLDNDYAAGQYGTAHTQKQNLSVTAAHEYFHAVQFAYDVNEDGWLMEATATWIEDEVYDGVNDNRYYLPYGPLRNPHVSLDRFSGLSAYGSWIFIRYLSERYPGEVGGLPLVVRQIWEQAAGSRYSVQAIRNVLTSKRTDLTTQFGRFATWNRRPSAHYSEGRAYQAAPLRASYTLRPGARTKRLEFGLNHLAAKHYRYLPSSTMKAGWRLRFNLNLNGRATGGAAFVTVKPDGRAPYTRRVSLNRYGKATVTFPFGRARVDWVEIAVVNASARYNCNLGADWYRTCGGRSLDDDARQVVGASAYRP